MKKLSFFAIALFAGSMAMAQSNTSTTTQTGDNNNATVDQTGSSNTSIISQTVNFGTAGHTANVTQDGTNNMGDVLQDQEDAEATLIQTGADNQILLKQSGENQASDIVQTGDRNKVGGYNNINQRAYQKNGTSFSNDANSVSVSQVGDDNQIGLWQEHHAAAANIDQAGDFNEAYLRQTGAPTGLIQSASISQTGDDHYADMNFYGDGNNFSLTQDGNALGGDNGLGNEVDVDVTGDGNVGVLSQTGTQNYADIDVTGNNNLTVDLSQNGIGNDADMDITGDDNSMSISQTGDGHMATETIIGNGNTINVTQGN